MRYTSQYHSCTGTANSALQDMLVCALSQPVAETAVAQGVLEHQLQAHHSRNSTIAATAAAGDVLVYVLLKGGLLQLDYHTCCELCNRLRTWQHNIQVSEAACTYVPSKV